MKKGSIETIKGSLVIGSGIKDISVGEVVEVGNERLLGETIIVSEDKFFVQVYEDTRFLKVGEPIFATGRKLVAELGPGILNNVFDGVERPLNELINQSGNFVKRGIKVNSLDRNKKYEFKPLVEKGSFVGENDIIGYVKENSAIEHKILVPYGIKGRVVSIEEGEFRIDEEIAKIEIEKSKKIVGINMIQYWPVREQRPFKERLELNEPIITGQRVIDIFFPLPKGGSACIPGGFGTGKTVLLQTLAKWSDVDIIIYVGCGERGNEICEILTEFPELKDPRTNKKLMERTTIIANTSNMPVVARETSVYMGITIAEYFRDQGYNVALMADSTSRWAEAIREIAGRLGEMPAEKGYPAYLQNKIAEFYERAGRFKCIGNPERVGSVSIIGAVSPPGGDFNEPVTIHTLRFTGVFWALDTELAYSRHFPAINWLKSYSLYKLKFSTAFLESGSEYIKNVKSYWENIIKGFEEMRNEAMRILTEASEIEAMARVVGEGALPDEQRVILLSGEILKEGFLRQSAYSEVDSFCPPEKQVLLLKIFLKFHKKISQMVEKGVEFEKIRNLQIIEKLKRLKEEAKIEKIIEVEKEIDKL